MARTDTSFKAGTWPSGDVTKLDRNTFFSGKNNNMLSYKLERRREGGRERESSSTFLGFSDANLLEHKGRKSKQEMVELIT